MREYVLSPENEDYERPTAIEYATEDAKSELMDLLAAHIPAADPGAYAVEHAELAALMDSRGAHFSYLPEASFLQVLPRSGEPHYFTLVNNRAFSNNAQLFNEENRRLPEEDTLSVIRGFVSSYPNMFFQVTEGDLDRFAAMLVSMASDGDYRQLVERFGVRRTAPWFWKLSDDMQAAYFAQRPEAAGLFDLNRYENP